MGPPRIRVLAGAGALAVAAGFLAPLDESFDAIGAFRLHLAVAGAVLTLVALGLRDVRTALLAGAATAVAVASLGPVWQAPTDPEAPEARDGPALTLVAANLYIDNPTPAALWPALLADAPDVIVTVETTVRQLAAAPPELDARYPHRVLHRAEDALRTAIFSRFPLTEGRLHLNNTIAPTGADAVLRVPGAAPLHLVGVHLSRPDEGLQYRQARALARITAGHARSLVIGDFNATPWSHALALAARASRTQPNGGFRITWRGGYPTALGRLYDPIGQQIDHALIPEGIAVEEIAPFALPGSDHAGLRLRLRLPTAP
ncbi:MAG: endonuclease/exonuclease/phosphatase family protein [Paracoccaceae bacterium]